MTIENLLKVLPPPVKPTYAFDGPWDVIEGQLRTRLPQDYKDLARLYGYGSFAGFFGIDVPAGPTRYSCLVYKALMFQRALIKEQKIPIYPQVGGFLICGSTDNAEYIGWLTRGATPDEWPIVVWDARPRSEEEEFTTFECDLTDFIANIIVSGGVFPGYDDDESLAWVQQQPPFEPSPDPHPGNF